MWNRVEASITDADIAAFKTAVNDLIAKLPRLGLTTKEWKKGGWSLSKKRQLLFKDTLAMAKFRPADFPKIDVAAFERDVKFMDDLESIQNDIRRVESHVEGVRRWTAKDVSEQSRYVYITIKLFNDLGVDGGFSHSRLKAFMPRSKNKGGETENA
jgi:hypothetical protein